MRNFTSLLEKNRGIKAKHNVGKCRGIYYVQSITGDGKTLKHEYYYECKKCNRFKFNRFYRVSITILCMIFFLFFTLVFSTPQGAIRRRLFIRDGIDSAFTSEINKMASNGINKESYIVFTESGKEIWRVESLNFVCFAFTDN